MDFIEFRSRTEKMDFITVADSKLQNKRKKILKLAEKERNYSYFMRAIVIHHNVKRILHS